MTTLKHLLQQKPIDRDAVEQHLNGLSHAQRVDEVRAIPGRLQAALFAAAPTTGLDVDFFVPPQTPERTFVRHFGKNSLPVFSDFEKRFARPSADADVAWGFNFSPVMAVVGPGHFVLRQGNERHPEMHVDYYSIPDEQLNDAPPLRENTSGLQTLVYGNMIDVLRRVSTHVSVGRAIKNGRDTNNYFLLCRDASSDGDDA